MPEESTERRDIKATNYFEKSELGMFVGRDINIGHPAGAGRADVSDIAELLDDALLAVDAAQDMSQTVRRRVREDLESARNSLTDEEPDPNRALDRVQSASGMLQEAATAAASAASIATLLAKAIQWLRSLAG